MARSIGDDELPSERVEVAVCDINSDALFTLGLEAVSKQGEIDAFSTSPFVVALRRGNLILECATRVDKKAAN